MTQAVFFVDTSTPVAAAATITGGSRDVGAAPGSEARYTSFQASFWADQAGTARIEVSVNGSTWRPATADTALAANVPAILSIPVTARYYRAVLVNGATLQGAVLVTSGFSRT